MFMRFVIPKINRESRRPEGLFQAAYALLEDGDLDEAEERQLRALIEWFEKNLPIPRHPYAKGRAIFWYQSSAHSRCLECVRRMWEIVNILRSHGYAVELQTCQRLGNIRYSDAYQVAAYPHKRDARIITRLI